MSTEASAAERAYQAIREGILTGSYASETMLGEASLAADLGLSRTPIRSALSRLQDEGWITVYPKRGALVRGLSDRAMVELCDARLILESTAVQRANDAARARLAETLDAEIDEQQAAFANQDLKAFIELTTAFHRRLVEAAQNEVLLELNDRLADRQRYVLYRYGDRLLARCDDIIAEHRQLASTMRDDNLDGFIATLRDHVSDAYGRDFQAVPLV